MKLEKIDWLEKGNSFFDEGRFEEAIGCYDRAIEKDPENSVAWTNKGACLSQLGKSEEAILCYDKSIQINPQEANTWAIKGNTLFDTGKFKEAVSCYDKALEINPQDTLVMKNKAEALSKLGLLDEAKQCLEKAQKIDSRKANNLINKGRKLFRAGKFMEATWYYMEALKTYSEGTSEWVEKWLTGDDILQIAEATSSKIREQITIILETARCFRYYPSTSLAIIEIASIFARENEIPDSEDLKTKVSRLIDVFKGEFVRWYMNDDYSEKCFDQIAEILTVAFKNEVNGGNIGPSQDLEDFWLRLSEIDSSLRPMTELGGSLLLNTKRSAEEEQIMFHSTCYTYIVGFEALFYDVIKRVFLFAEEAKDGSNKLKKIEEEQISISRKLWIVREGYKQLLHDEPIFLEPKRLKEKINIRNAIGHGQAKYCPDQPENCKVQFKFQQVDKQNKRVTYQTVKMSFFDFNAKWLEISDVIDSFRYILMIIDMTKRFTLCYCLQK